MLLLIPAIVLVFLFTVYSFKELVVNVNGSISVLQSTYKSGFIETLNFVAQPVLHHFEKTPRTDVNLPELIKNIRRLNHFLITFGFSYQFPFFTFI